ncbi:DinB family protein [Anatilimnocola floriformis]|uniref:DinB family protein n=1 Tax=Anatilimnocola floriformis TaxID=2948575 RepID=UPI0020C313AF|nr:DinB family protein [Anatilimnocola floriformis]
MSYADVLLPEFDAEMASTRKVLERVPEDKWDWKCHPKSHTIGWNANHIAEIPGWVAGSLQFTEWDVSPVGGEPYRTPTYRTRQELLAFFDKNVAEARTAIQTVKDEDLGVAWSLKSAGQTILTMPRAAVVRTFVMNHLIHHRAILTVYFRLNDVPVPGMYGPSGDE